jgi:heme A synthase
MALEFALGEFAGPTSMATSMLHAFLAPVVLSTVVTIALATSPGWQRDPVTIQDRGWPPMGSLAMTTLVFVVIQVALGAAFRHGALGVLPHILGALVMAILILTLVICLTQMAEHPTLKPGAFVLLVLTFLQIFLGLTLLSMGSLTGTKLPAVIFGMTHVALGAITLATSVVVMLEARRCVRKPAG